MLGHRDRVYPRGVREDNVALDHLAKQQAADARRGGMHPPESLPREEQSAWHAKAHVSVRVNDRLHHFRTGRLVSIAVRNSSSADELSGPSSWRGAAYGVGRLVR